MSRFRKDRALWISCDGAVADTFCQAHVSTYGEWDDVRRLAKAAGWLALGEKDFCRECKNQTQPDTGPRKWATSVTSSFGASVRIEVIRDALYLAATGEPGGPFQGVDVLWSLSPTEGRELAAKLNDAADRAER